MHSISSISFITFSYTVVRDGEKVLLLSRVLIRIEGADVRIINYYGIMILHGIIL